ncbi:hypothetical protein PIB30_065079 [Stylosanthes scabra]|uniref:Putative plant transposon protein domain-containing protein n=1 Tax=Stylosanthes scabra TaxID=79078 RepID=A0ABU6QMJ2_9FABA|nr:hypothetical protein [Stylosanthes scabra]
MGSTLQSSTKEDGARMKRRDKQSNPHYMTFVRGKDIDFSPESIRVILQLPDIDDSEQSYEARRKTDDQRLNDVLRDIGEPFAQWKLDKKGKPSQIKRRELNPTARGWFDFVRRSLLPSSNNCEVTVERVVLIHSIIEGLDIKAKLLITKNISAAAETKDQAKRPITTESMTKNKYLEIQQEIQQQFPQVQQEQNQHDQTLAQQFNRQELNQQFQQMRVDQSNFYQNFQEQQKQFFEDFGNQQKLYKQEFQDLRVQQHQYHQELQNQQTLTNKTVQELKKSQDKHHKEFLTHKKELQRQYQKDHEEYVTITNHEIEFRKRTDLKMDY